MAFVPYPYPLMIVLCCLGSFVSVDGLVPVPVPIPASSPLSSLDGSTRRRIIRQSPASGHPSQRHRVALMLSEQNEKETQEEIERYRNRAALTQSILKEKVEEVKLLKNKITLLSDVVGRLKTESKRELGQQLKDKESKHIEILATLQSALDGTMSLMDAQAEQHAQVVKDLQADLSKEVRDSSKSKEQAARAQRLFDNQVKALQNEVLDMDDTLETTQGELQKVQRRLVAREDDIRSKALQEGRKVSSLEEKMKILEEEREFAIMDSRQAEELRRESLEIANASIQAAAKREDALQEELDLLKVSMLTVVKEKGQLAAVVKNEDEGSGQVEGSGKLIEKIILLEGKLEEQRLASDIGLKVERERFESTLQAERRKHEEDLRRLRLRIERENGSSAVRKKGGLNRIWRRFRSR